MTTPSQEQGTLAVEHDLENYPENYYLPDLGTIDTPGDLSVQYTAPSSITTETRAALKVSINGLQHSQVFFLLPAAFQGMILKREEEALPLAGPMARVYSIASTTTVLPNFGAMVPIAKSLVKWLCTGELDSSVPFVGLAKESSNFALQIT